MKIKEDIVSIYHQASNSKKFRQASLLYSVNLISIPIGIVTSIVVTRFLGAQVYGDYKFMISLFTLVSILVNFGFFQAGNRAIVLCEDRKIIKQIYGVLFIITIALFVVMMVALYTYSILDKNLIDKGIDGTFRLILPISFLFLLQKYFETLFQADNKIKLLAISRIWYKILFLILITVLYLLFLDFKGDRLVLIWILFGTAKLVSFVWVISKIKLSFVNFKRRIKEIWNFNKSFGIDVYIGSIFAVGFASLLGILISYFGEDNSGVGFYSLALTFSAPLSFIPNVIATTNYKDFSKNMFIPKKIILITIGLSLSAIVALWIIISPFVNLFYGDEFAPVIKLTLIVSFGVIFHGLADFFNRFLGSHGQDKSLRNSSIIVGISILLFAFLFIPHYGEYGAALSKVFGGIIYCSIMLFYYIKLKRSLSLNN